MTPFGSTLPTELRRIQLRSRKLITGDLLGQYRSAFRGTGLVFSELREYQPGDDVKHIHWKATARANTVLVKSYEEERQLRVLLAVDVSASMAASVGIRSSAKAIEFCSLIGSLTQRGNDMLGLLPFADTPGTLLRPKAGPKVFSRIMATLLAEEPRGTKTDMAAAFRHLRLSVGKPSILFIISDFMCDDFQEDLAPLAARHDVVLVQLQHPTSLIPTEGLISFRDAETGEYVDVDLGNRSVLEAWTVAIKNHSQALRETATSCGAAHIVVSDSCSKPLMELMRERVRRISR